jgi:hypothetical protein
MFFITVAAAFATSHRGGDWGGNVEEVEETRGKCGETSEKIARSFRQVTY